MLVVYLLLVVLKLCFLANTSRMETLIMMELRKIIPRNTANTIVGIICWSWSHISYHHMTTVKVNTIKISELIKRLSLVS